MQYKTNITVNTDIGDHGDELNKDRRTDATGISEFDTHSFIIYVKKKLKTWLWDDNNLSNNR